MKQPEKKIDDFVDSVEEEKDLSKSQRKELSNLSEDMTRTRFWKFGSIREKIQWLKYKIRN